MGAEGIFTSTSPQANPLQYLYTRTFSNSGSFLCNVSVSINGAAYTTSTSFMRLTVRTKPDGLVTVSPAATTVGADVTLNGQFTGGGSLPLQYKFFYVTTSPPATRLGSSALLVFQSGAGSTLTRLTQFLSTDLVNGKTTSICIRMEITNAEGGINSGIFSSTNITLNPVANAWVTLPSTTTVGATVPISVYASKGTPGYTFTLTVTRGGSAIDVVAGTTGNPSAVVNYVFSAVQLSGSLPTQFGAQIVARDSVNVNSPTNTSATLITVNPAPTPFVSFAPPVTTAGGNITFYGTVLWGSPPYTFQFHVMASDGVTLIASMTGIATSSTVVSARRVFANGELNTVASLPIATSFKVKLTVTDSAGVSGSVTNATAYLVNPVPVLGSISGSPTTATVGTPVVISASVAKGTPPYTYSFFVLTSGGAQLAALSSVTTAALSASASYSFSLLELSGAATTNFLGKAVVVDSMGVTATTTTFPTLTINPPPVGTVIVTPSPATSGATVTLQVTGVTGGTDGTFVYKFELLAADGSTLIDGTIPTVSTTARSASTTYTLPSSTVTTTYVVRCNITDATGGKSVTPQAATTLIAAAAPTATALALPLAVTVGVSVNLTVAGLTGGTAPYSFQWGLINMGGTSVGSAIPLTTSTSTFYLLDASLLLGGAATMIRGRVVVTDGAGFTLTLTTAPFTVNPAPTATLGTYPNMTTSGAPYALTAGTVTGGAAPLTYVWRILSGPVGGVIATVTGTSGLTNYAFPTVSAPTVFQIQLQIQDAVGVLSPAVTGPVDITVNPIPTALVTGAPALTTASVPVRLTVTNLQWGTPGLFRFGFSFVDSANASAVVNALTVTNTSTPVYASYAFADTDLSGGQTTTFNLRLVVIDAAGGSSGVLTAGAPMTVNPRPRGALGPTPSALGYGENVTLSCANTTLGTGALSCRWSVVTISAGVVTVIDSSLPAVATVGGAAQLTWTIGSAYIGGTTYYFRLIVEDSLGAQSDPAFSSPMDLGGGPSPPTAEVGLSPSQLATAITVPIVLFLLVLALCLLLLCCWWLPKKRREKESGSGEDEADVDDSKLNTTASTWNHSYPAPSPDDDRDTDADTEANTEANRRVGYRPGERRGEDQKDLVSLVRTTYLAIGDAKRQVRDAREEDDGGFYDTYGNDRLYDDDANEEEEEEEEDGDRDREAEDEDGMSAS